jgi:hypothetical protein
MMGRWKRRLALSAERRAPSAERRAPSAERRVPSAERYSRQEDLVYGDVAGLGNLWSSSS